MKKSIILVLFFVTPSIFYAMQKEGGVIVPPLRLTKSDQLPHGTPCSKQLERTRSCDFKAAAIDHGIFTTATQTLSARRSSTRVATVNSGSPRNEIRPRTSSLSLHCESAHNN